MPLEEGDSALERVAVLRSDLEYLQHVLDRAHSYTLALDVAEGYKQLAPATKRSPLTNMLARAHNKVEGYIPSEEAQDELWTPEQLQ